MLTDRLMCVYRHSLQKGKKEREEGGRSTVGACEVLKINKVAGIDYDPNVFEYEKKLNVTMIYVKIGRAHYSSKF